MCWTNFLQISVPMVAGVANVRQRMNSRVTRYKPSISGCGPSSSCQGVLIGVLDIQERSVVEQVEARRVHFILTKEVGPNPLSKSFRAR